jgi:flagellar M-ring protein FliF
MDALQQTLKNIGLVRLALMAALLVGVGSGLYYAISRFNKPEMALLYGDIDMADAGKIVGRLETMNVPVEVKGGGGQIYVPADQVARLRLDLAELGLPKAGAMGYEIFDNQESLGVSSFVQGIHHVRALEGEISRTIGAMAQVTRARVHLVLPRRKLFSRENDEPSAAIMLSLAGPGRLSNQKIQAIQQLVAAAVPGLAAERVSIVDDRGNLLARGDGDSTYYSAAQMDERKIAYENRLSQIVENLVGKYVGEGRVRAEVSVEMDFDRVTENNESYIPDGQVVRSSQIVKTDEESNEPGSQSSTVENKLPQSQGSSSGSGSAKSNRTEETLNYEISKKITSHVKETGGLKRLSVAVLVDGILETGKGQGKEATYKPRPEEELKQLTKLVQSAIGYNKERGDVVEVINMRFAPMELLEAEAKSDPFLGFSKHDIVRLVESLIIALISLLVLLLVVKPLFNRILESMKAQDQPNLPLGALSRPEQEGLPALQAANNGTLALEGVNEDVQNNVSPLPSSLEQMISIKKVEGQIRNSSLKSVGEVIDNNLDGTVSVLRGWMAEKGK